MRKQKNGLGKRLENGLDPNLPNYLRMTPLHALAAPRHNLTFANPLRDEQGSVEKAKLALTYGADINAIELFHDATPLGWAAKFGSLTMARFLLEAGADPQLAGAPWAEPVAMAQRGGYTEIADLLTPKVSELNYE